MEADDRARGTHRTATGHRLTVWSHHATAMELRIFDRDDPDWLLQSVPMERTRIAAAPFCEATVGPWRRGAPKTP